MSEAPDAATAAAADHLDPHQVLRQWDQARHRSGKTTRAREAGRWGVGPSDLSSCQRAVWYRENPPDGYVPDDVPVAAAALGTMIHTGFTEARRLAFPWRKFDMQVTIPGTDTTGTLDEWDPVLGRVTDYKTAGSYKWAKVALTPPMGEWNQVLVYGFCLAAEGHDIREVEIVVINRENGDIETHVRPYDPDLAMDAVLEIHAMINALDEGRELPRVRAGDTLLGPTVDTLCRTYCPAVRHCWNLDEVPEGRSPEGALLAVDDPDIEAAAARYEAARVREKEAEAEKEYARALLQGVPAAEYGAFEVRWQGGNSKQVPDLLARIEVLETELIDAAADSRPPKTPWELPSPTRAKTSPVTIRVKPKRAATVTKEEGKP